MAILSVLIGQSTQVLAILVVSSTVMKSCTNLCALVKWYPLLLSSKCRTIYVITHTYKHELACPCECWELPSQLKCPSRLFRLSIAAYQVSEPTDLTQLMAHDSVVAWIVLFPVVSAGSQDN